MQILDQLEDLGLDGHVQGGGGLVADQDLGLAGQGDGDHDALAHTAGILEGIVVKPGGGVGDAHLVHQVQRAVAGLHLGAVLVLEDHGGDLLPDGDDGVQGGHGVLEHGGNPAAPDLAPVLGVLHVGQVQNAGAVELLRRLVQVLHPEGHVVKDGVALGVVGQVHPQLHGLFQCLQQLVGILVSLFQAVPPHGQVDLLGQDLVALQRLLRDLALDLPLVLGLEAGVLILIAFHILRVHRYAVLFLLRQLLVPLVQLLDLCVVLLDGLRRRPDLVLLLGGIIGLLQVIKLGALVLKLLQLRLLRLLLRAAQAALFLLLALQLQDFAVGGGPQLQVGVFVQLLPGPVHEGAGPGVQLDHRVRQLVVAEDDGAVVDIAVGVQHPGEGLGKHRLTRAGLAHDGDGFVLVDIQGDAADGGEDSAPDPELHVQILDGQQYLSFFHNSRPLTYASWDRTRRPGSGPPHTAPR